MTEGTISKYNVGRIAERIAAIELEYRGFHVTDLNKDGIKANADLLASRGGKTWQIQVKGSTGDGAWWFNYGFCNDELIQDKTKPVFNRAESFYRAQFVVLICVSLPNDYRCIVMPVLEAERAAQLNLDLFRMKKSDGTAKKPGKMWCSLDLPKTRSQVRERILHQEKAIIEKYQNTWNLLAELDPS